jgi:hypothetical protein
MKQLILLLLILISSITFSQTITNVTPSSGRVDSCVSQTISWNSSGTSGYYNIYYSMMIC